MKKLYKLLLITFSLCLVLCAGIFAGCGGEDKYRIFVDESGFSVKDGVISVEYGEQFVIPEYYVLDADGTVYEDIVGYKLTDSRGNDITGFLKIYDLSIGNYGLTFYYTEEDVSIKDVSYSVIVADTKSPEVKVVGINRAYTVGETCAFGIQTVKDASGIDESRTLFKALYLTDGTEIEITDNSFELLNEGNYRLEIHYFDNVGNETALIYDITATAAYEEPQVDNVLWGFEEQGCLANIHPTAKSDDISASVSDEKISDSLNSLKLDLKAESTIEFYLQGANATAVSEMSLIVIKVYATNLIDHFRLYDPQTGREINFDYKILKDAWMEISFDPWDYFAEERVISEFRIQMYTEEAATLYIDGIYYIDYVEPWADENLTEGILADFDEIEYRERVLQISTFDHSSFAGQTEILPAGSDGLPTGSNGGVIKFTTSTDPATVSQGLSRDGFVYKIPKGIKTADVSALSFRVDLQGYNYERCTVAFSTDLGDTAYIWIPISPVASGWQEIYVSEAQIKGVVDAYATTIKSIHIRLLRRTAGDWTAYFDEIKLITEKSLQELFDAQDYSFSGVDQLKLAQAVGTAAIVGIVDDTDAKDGKALLTRTAYYQTESGVKILFDNIDISEYTKIVLTLKTSTNVSFSINDVYINFPNCPVYTEIDIKRLMRGEKSEEIGTTLSSITIGRTTVRDIDIYIDGIEFVPAAENINDLYKFDDADMMPYVEWKQATGSVGIVEDADATDGSALQLQAPSPNFNAYIYLFDDVALSDYFQIILRVKWVDVNVSMYTMSDLAEGIGLKPSGCVQGVYYEIDLKQLLTAKNATVLKGVSFWSGANQAGIVNIDSITFVKKIENGKIVSFDANGHGTAPAMQQVVSGGTIARPADLTDVGYNFVGWFTQAEGGEEFDFDTSITADITLYAHWEMKSLNDLYTFGENSAVPAVSGAGQAATVSIAADADATDGYALKLDYTGKTAGWATDTFITLPVAITPEMRAACQHIYIRIKSTAPASSGDRLFLTNSSNYMSRTQLNPTANITTTANAYVLWDILEYYDETTHSDKTIIFLDFLKLEKAGIFYIDYIEFVEKADAKTVSFDANGHGTAPVDQIVESGATATKPSNPTDSDYKFIGWFTQADGGEEFDFTTPITESITLYAQWQAKTINDKFAFDGTTTAPANSGAATVSVVADAAATDGYALKLEFTSFGTGSKTYIELPVSITPEIMEEYDHIYLNVRSTSPATNDVIYLAVTADSTSGNAGTQRIGTATADAYTQFDIKKTTDKTITHLCFQKASSAGDIYIDSIVFAKD